MKPRKNQKLDSSNKIKDKDIKGEAARQSLSSYSSDGDDEPNAVIGGLSLASNTSEDALDGTNGKKTRTKGGIANDPQSIYARVSGIIVTHICLHQCCIICAIN